MPDISVKIDRKVYRRENGDVNLLRDISFVAKQGQITVILGESGCGKSTLLRLIVGLDKDFQGAISETHRQNGIGMVFQDIRLLPWKTVRENVRFAAANPSEFSDGDIDSLLKLVHLNDASDVLPKDLSGGMAQRAALARALVNEPEVLLLDEPFSSLDGITRYELQNELLQIVHEKKVTCIFVTHDLDEAVFLADALTLISASQSSVSACEEIRLSRPRDRLSPEFAIEKARIGNFLQSLAQKQLF